MPKLAAELRAPIASPARRVGAGRRFGIAETKLRWGQTVDRSNYKWGDGDMNTGDGSMTFDWIFFVIVAIPMVFAAWELYKTPAGLSSK